MSQLVKHDDATQDWSDSNRDARTAVQPGLADPADCQPNRQCIFTHRPYNTNVALSLLASRHPVHYSRTTKPGLNSCLQCSIVYLQCEISSLQISRKHFGQRNFKTCTVIQSDNFCGFCSQASRFPLSLDDYIKATHLAAVIAA